MAEIINALKRLERVGDEHSVSNAKLRAAAWQVAQLLAKILPVGGDFPRGYRVEARSYPEPLHVLFAPTGEMINPISGPDSVAHGAALAFAGDLVDGLLDELATWFGADSKEEERRAERLSRAADVLREGA